MATSRASRASSSRPYEVLFQMVIGKWISQALGTVVEIGVPEQLAKGARRCSDIALEAGVSEDGIYRLLRALASVGLFVESADRRFKLTRMGKLLQSDHPESLAGYARFVAHDSTWRPWGQLGYSVKTGMPAFDHVFNVPIFEHLSRNPEVAAVFDNAMTSISATQARATSDAYDFKGVKVLIVDPVVPPGNAPHYGKLIDLEMLVLTPRGRERTKAQFVRLLRGAGFRLSRVIATESPLSIVEAVKA